MSKNFKLKKVNKSFVSEPISCFADSYVYAYEHYERFMHVNILVVYFWTHDITHVVHPKSLSLSLYIYIYS